MKKTQNNQRRILGVIGLAAIAAGTASAATISVNFHVTGDAQQSEHVLGSSELAGLNGGVANWNNFGVGTAGTNASGTMFATTVLNDDSGAATGSTISTTVGTRFVGYAASAAATGAELNLAGTDHDKLFNSYLGTNSGDGITLTISNLGTAFTSGGYRLVVYSDTDRGPASSNVRTSVFTITPSGGSAFSLLTEDDGSTVGGATFTGSYILSDGDATGVNYSNYVTSATLNASSFTLSIDTPDGGRGGISGFQIVAVPEPSSVALLAGAFGLLALRRRRI